MFKVVWNVIKTIFGVVFTILSPLKRLWCRRKRRLSDAILPIVNYYPSTENLTPPAQNDSTQMASWDSWEDPQKKRQEQMSKYEQYRQEQLQQQSEEPEPEPEPDYFQSMAPVVKKQTKVLVKKNEPINTGAISNRLAVASDIPLSQSSELESWEDETQTWEDEAGEDLSWEADNAIREKRKADRQQRQLQQQRKKDEREFKNNVRTMGQFSAVKLS